MYEFAVIDTETTGLPNQPHNRVVEIGVIRLSPSLQIVDEFETLINPERDLGPSWLHGITGRDVAAAPRFEDVAGDVLDRIHGCILVAHNAPFDVTFLQSEFHRIGVNLPSLPNVCTMRMVRDVGPQWLSTDLEGCCAGLGIANLDPHRAMSDARATAELFRLLAERMFGKGGIDLQRLNCNGQFPWSFSASNLNRFGRTWKRKDAQAEHVGPSPHLSRLVYRLAGTIRLHNVEHELAGYLDALDRVLEDRMLTSEEAEGLLDVALLWNRRPEEIVEAHRLYLRRLAVVALSDGTVSDAELGDLRLVNGIFGFDENFLTATIDEARALMPMRQATGESLVSKSVCFTGESICTIQGEIITRERANELAARSGLSVKSSVTKKLDVLVVADPHTQSGKAKKARDYDIRILHEPVFWRMIGVQVD